MPKRPRSSSFSETPTPDGMLPPMPAPLSLQTSISSSSSRQFSYSLPGGIPGTPRETSEPSPSPSGPLPRLESNSSSMTGSLPSTPRGNGMIGDNSLYLQARELEQEGTLDITVKLPQASERQFAQDAADAEAQSKVTPLEPLPTDPTELSKYQDKLTCHFNPGAISKLIAINIKKRWHDERNEEIARDKWEGFVVSEGKPCTKCDFCNAVPRCTIPLAALASNSNSSNPTKISLELAALTATPSAAGDISAIVASITKMFCGRVVKEARNVVLERGGTMKSTILREDMKEAERRIVAGGVFFKGGKGGA